MNEMIKQIMQNVNPGEVEKTKVICQALRSTGGLNMIVFDDPSRTDKPNR